jgi:hypothetical protein
MQRASKGIRLVLVNPRVPRSFAFEVCREDNLMARIVVRVSILKGTTNLAACALAYLCLMGPVAFAQHAGAGGHFGGGMGAPHVSAPPISHAPVSRPHTYTGPVFPATSIGGFRYRWRPIYPYPPVFFGPGFFFGSPFFWYGGFNSYWWQACGPFWTWSYACGSYPYYGYGFGNYVPFYAYGNPEPLPTYEYPSYAYRDRYRDLPELYLKDGTAYDVTDYWLVDNQLHFTMLEEGGTKSVERVIDFDDLDLQRTIDINTRRGFRFVLRNEPLEQYLQDHPDGEPPENQPMPNRPNS